MPDAFEVKGADDIAALVKRINSHADKKAFNKELRSGLNRVSKPVREEMKDSTGAPPVLPTRGGLQALMQSKQSVTTSIRGGKYAGVRISAKSRKGGFDLGSIHRTGRIRHPVFGRGPWVLQSQGVKPGWMDDTFDAQKPEVTRAIVRVMEEIARKVEH